jgi:hypothetical protein
MRAMKNNEWQPIETAAKDGSAVLGYGPAPYSEDGMEIAAVHWIENKRFPHVSGWHVRYPSFEDFNTERQPTHWMPLPEPPK